MAVGAPEVLIIGAGVMGLTAGVRLAEHGIPVRVRTDRRPAETTSAAAGAMWDPIFANHLRVPEWGQQTFRILTGLAAAGRPEVRLVRGIEASRSLRVVPECRQAATACASSRPPDGFRSAWRYEVPVVDMPRYLAYLERRLLAAGGRIEMARVESIDQAVRDFGIVVNCSGTGARSLVPDDKVESVRGELVVVRNPGIAEFFLEYTDRLEEMTYLLPQGDLLLLGGSAEAKGPHAEVDPAVAAGILARCAAVEPRVAGAEIVELRIGHRPQRPEVRLEIEKRTGGYVVHNYGHGGAGVSLSWGCAEEVVAQVTTVWTGDRGTVTTPKRLPPIAG